MTGSRRALCAENLAAGVLIVLALIVAGVSTRDAWRQVGQPFPGFAVLEGSDPPA